MPRVGRSFCYKVRAREGDAIDHNEIKDLDRPRLPVHLHRKSTAALPSLAGGHQRRQRRNCPAIRAHAREALKRLPLGWAWHRAWLAWDAKDGPSLPPKR